MRNIAKDVWVPQKDLYAVEWAWPVIGYFSVCHKKYCIITKQRNVLHKLIYVSPFLVLPYRNKRYSRNTFIKF